MKRFEDSIKGMFQNLLMNYKVGLINGFLPSFLTLSSLAIVLGFSSYAKMITLDFIGVTLRLFQSLGNLTGTMNQIINSHVHIEKFYEIDNNRLNSRKTIFKFTPKNTIEVNNLNFKYFNSDINIF